MIIFVVQLLLLIFINDGTSSEQESILSMKNEQQETKNGDYQLAAMVYNHTK